MRVATAADSCCCCVGVLSNVRLLLVSQSRRVVATPKARRFRHGNGRRLCETKVFGICASVLVLGIREVLTYVKELLTSP